MSNESLKRVLMGLRGAAKGFKKEKMAGRISPQKPPTALGMEGDDPLDTPPMGKPDAMGAMGDDSPGMTDSPAEEAGETDLEAAAEPDASADEKLAAIRKLIGSV